MTSATPWRWMLLGLVCAASSAAMFFLSTGLGEIWALAWLAPAPLLWLAYGRGPAWIAALAAFIAFSVGQLAYLEAFAGQTTAIRMVTIAIVATAVLFAAAILFARLAQRRLAPLLAVCAFPAAWTSVEYGVSLFSPNGSVGALAYTQVGAPALIQSASVFGLWLITFLLCFVASCLTLAMHDRRRRIVLAGVGLAAFAANAAFGAVQLASPRGPTVRVAVAALDPAETGRPFTAASWIGYAADYADRARRLAAQGATTIVLPEKLAVLKPQWRDATLAPLALAAREAKVRIIAGFDDVGPVQRNIAVTFWPNGAVSTYVKRRLILGLDQGVVPGDRPGLLGGAQAVVICKDMDYPAMIRGDAQTPIRLMFVPAEDFVVDHWMHERIAVLRGVENGFSVVRAARKGDLLVTDPQGRILALAPSTPTLAARIVDVPLGRADTPYRRIGDVFAWACLAAAALLLIASAAPRRRPRPD